MKEKTVYKRSFKNLVTVFLIFAMIVFGNGLNCVMALLRPGWMSLPFIAVIVLKIAADVIIAEALTFLAMSGFNKYTFADIFSAKKNTVIFSLVTVIAGAVFSLLGICCMCAVMYCGVYC